MMKTRTGYLYKRKDSRVWQVQWRVDGKCYGRSTGEREIGKAREKQREIMAPFAVGHELQVLQNVAGRIQGLQEELKRLQLKETPKIESAWAEYLASPERRDTGPQTLTQNGYKFAAFAEWAGERGLTVLGEIGREWAAAFAKHLQDKQYSGETYNKYIRVLSMVWVALAVPENPWVKIRRKNARAFARRELTVEELGQLIGAAKTPELKTLVALGIYTGMRLGDCCTLRCADVAGGMIVRTNRKTGKVTRIPVHHALAPMLQGRGEYLLPEFADLYLNHRMSVVEKMNDLFADAGIVTTSGEYSTGRARTVAGFHSLRHTFVSLCRTAGVPLAVVESLVGHTSAAMTRHYTHIGEAAAASAIALLPTVTGKSTVPRKKGGIQK